MVRPLLQGSRVEVRSRPYSAVRGCRGRVLIVRRTALRRHAAGQQRDLHIGSVRLPGGDCVPGRAAIHNTPSVNANPTTKAFVPSDAAGWAIGLPSDRAAISAQPCTTNGEPMK